MNFIEEQKNSNFDIQKMNEINDNNLCERCKNAPIILICEECSPFHNFCQKCDGIIHQLPSRINHSRKKKFENINNKMLYTYNINSNSSPNLFIKQRIIGEKINNLINNVNEEISKEKEIIPNEFQSQNNIYNQYENMIENNNENYVEDEKEENQDYNEISNNNHIYHEGIMDNQNIKDINFIEIPNQNKEEANYKNVFSKEYILELQNIHQKEKSQLLFKISSLENTIDRIKCSFNEQMRQIQQEQNKNEKEMSSKLSQIKNDFNLKYKNIQTEKVLEISLLKEKLNKEEKEKNEFKISLEKIQKEYKILQNNSAKNMDEICTDLDLIKNEYDDFRQETDKIINKLKNEYENKIKTILEDNENKIIDISIKHKMELDNMNNNLNLKYENTIQDLKKENSQLKEDNIILIEKINEIENYLDKMHTEYNNAANGFNNTSNDLNLKISQKTTENDELKKRIEESKKELEKIYEQLHQKNDENEKLKKEMIMLNNSVNNFKKNNEILNENYKKLQKEYNDLSVNSVNISMEYNNKIKSLNFIEDRNAMLERENNHLRNQLNKCINPFEQ